MSYQKCPVCNGTGNRPDAYTSNNIEKCPVCFGTRIISEITGRPPQPLDLPKIDMTALMKMTKDL